MPDQGTSFERALEEDMKVLAAEIKNQRARPELKDAGEQELLREAIRAFPQLEKKPEAPAARAAASDAGGDAKSPLPGYAQSAPAETKLEIEYLLELAFREGPVKALNESKKSPAFVQDAFHDALAGRLYPELQRRGFVK